MSISLLVCPACQNRGSAKFLEKVGQYNLYVCMSCALTFSEPMQAASRDFYEAHREYDDKWEFKFIHRKIQELGLKGSLLDIGCGDGIFMEMMSKQFAVTGLDISPYAVKSAKSKRRLNDVYPLTLQEYRKSFSSNRYDVVTALHILEHVEEPHRFIADIKQCLKPHSLLVIAVPNPKRWVLRWVREMWDYPPHHLTRWTIHNLCALLEGHNFAVIEVDAERIATFGQVRSVLSDIIWAVVFKKFHFGIMARIDASKERPAGHAHFLIIGLWAILVNLKGKAIRLVSYLSALFAYPAFWLGGYEGKSILVLARSRD